MKIEKLRLLISYQLLELSLTQQEIQVLSGYGKFWAL